MASAVPESTAVTASRRQPAAGRADLRPWLAATAVVVFVPVLLRESFLSMAVQWRTPTFGYGALVGPLAVFLVWWDRCRLLAVPARPTTLPLLLAVPVLLAWSAGIALGIQVLHQAAAVMIIGLSVWTVLGHRVSRGMLFPLLYLLLMVPVGEVLVPPLMRLTADFAVAAVSASGVPVYQDGFVFSLPSGDFEVIRECSGIRFLLATVAVGIAFARIAFGSLRKRLIFVGLCCVVPVAANLVRAYGVVLIVHLTDMRFAAGGDHILYGTIFFAAVLFGLFLLGARYADPRPVIRSRAAPSPQWTFQNAGAVAAGFLLLVAGASLLPATLQGQMEAPPARALPAIPGWRGPLAPSPDWQAVFHEPLLETAGGYLPEQGRGPVQVYRAVYGGLGDVASSVNRLSDGRWREIGGMAAAGPPWPHQELRLRGPEGQGRVVWWWYAAGGRTLLQPWRVQAMQLERLLTGSGSTVTVVAVSASFERHPDEARSALHAFLAAACAADGLTPCLAP